VYLVWVQLPDQPSEKYCAMEEFPSDLGPAGAPDESENLDRGYLDRVADRDDLLHTFSVLGNPESLRMLLDQWVAPIYVVFDKRYRSLHWKSDLGQQEPVISIFLYIHEK
jgi:hypothetical protein